MLNTKVLPFDQSMVRVAVEINNRLKRDRRQIGIADLFIAATAIAHDLPIATLNTKHFNRIGELQILE
ncbi:type II toxin-antitoxin system VapC family toxin [Dyadobacter psychrotolerans]|nr:type II toxin-antitoxin system VapC family toxin [Dyadobacter psychrotolerans]